MTITAQKMNSLAWLALMLLCLSCNDVASNLGADFVQTSTFDIATIDTLTLKVSTVFFDSLRTNGPDKLLLGYHLDEKLGPITAASVFQLVPNKVASLDKDHTTYEALRLTFKTSGYYYYDTTNNLSVSVHRVNNQIQLFNGGKYNSSQYSVDPTPLGRLTFQTRPLHTKDTLEIPLSDDLGKEIFGLLQQGDNSVLQSDQFLKYILGMAIIPDKTSSTCILGINASPELRLYYYDKSVFPSAEKFISYSTGSGIYFNSITSDRSSTVVKDLTTLKSPVSTTATGNIAFMQSGIGLGIRVEVPYIRNLLLTNPAFSASSAILEMVPVKSYKTKTTPIPLSLTGYIVDSENSILSTSSVSAVLVDDTENLERNLRYRVDITSFLNQQIATDALNENALLFLVSDANFRNSLAKVAVGDAKSDYQMKLNVYFVTLPINK